MPRIINVIADATLLFAYGIDRRDIDVSTTTEALAELDATGVLASYEQEGVDAAHATTVSVAETEEALRMADEMRRREQVLVTRERDLARREQAIQVQQRVVEEEARLMASTRVSRPDPNATAGPTSMGSVATSTPTPADSASRLARAPSTYITPSGVRVQRPPESTPVRHKGWWDRVRRLVIRVTESHT